MATRSHNGKARNGSTSTRKRTSTPTAKRAGAPDALTLLHEDHEAVGAMIDEIADCDPGDSRLAELARSIAGALTVHAKIEEDLFYPELRDRSEDDEQLTDVFEAYTEHDVIKHLLVLIKSGKGPDEQFKAELQVLGESVKHHVKEEESTIFKLARKFMSREELETCGAEMADEKERLEATPSKKR